MSFETMVIEFFFLGISLFFNVILVTMFKVQKKRGDKYLKETISLEDQIKRLKEQFERDGKTIGRYGEDTRLLAQVRELLK